MQLSKIHGTGRVSMVMVLNSPLEEGNKKYSKGNIVEVLNSI